MSGNASGAAPVRAILATTDFGDASTAAVRVAAKLALAYQAKLTVAHIMEPLLARSEFFRDDAEKHLLADADEGLRKVLETMGGTVRSMMIETVTRSGRPAAELIKLAAEKQSDLLVMGTHGKRGLDRLLIGSTAEKLVRRAPCSVLVVRHDLPDFFQHPVVAVDFSDSSGRAVRRGIQLCESFGISTLPVLHVLQVPDRYLKPEFSRDEAVRRIIEMAETQGNSWLEPFAKSTSVQLKLTVAEGPPSETLADLGRKMSADLMLMGTHGRTDAANLLIGSVSERVMRTAPFSVYAERSDKQVIDLFRAMQTLLG